MKRRYFVYSIILAFFLLCGGFLWNNAEVGGQKQAHAQEQDVIQQSSDSGEDIISAKNIADRYELDQPIGLCFKVGTDVSLTPALSEADGCEISTQRQEGKEVFVTILPSAQDFTLKVAVSKEDQTYYGIVHGIVRQQGVFVSSFSFDDADFKSYDYLLNNGYITQNQFDYSVSNYYKGQRNQINNSSSFINEFTQLSVSPTTVISGTLFWEDDRFDGSQATTQDKHPMIFTKIDVMIGMSAFTTVYTDENGEFTTTITQFTNTPITLRIYPAGNGIDVARSIAYSYVFNTIDMFERGGNYTVEYVFTKELHGDFWKAIQIGQAATVARKYIKTISSNAALDQVLIWYPSENGSYYVPSENSIYIDGTNYTGENAFNSYESWDVIMHEYGHHVQNNFAIDNSPGGHHFYGVDCAEHIYEYTQGLTNCPYCLAGEASWSETWSKEECKDAGDWMAWSEGWATAFAQMAQNYYATYLSDIFTVADGCYTSNGERISNINIKDPMQLNGEANEMVAASFVYNLVFSSQEGGLGLTDQQVWNILATCNPTKLVDLINCLKMVEDLNADVYINDFLKRAGLLTNMSIVNISLQTTPTITWTNREFYSDGFSVNPRVRAYISTTMIRIKDDEDTVFQVLLPGYYRENILQYIIPESQWENILANSSNETLILEIQDTTSSGISAIQIKSFSKPEVECLQSVAVAQLHSADEYLWYKFTAQLAGEYQFLSSGNVDTCGALFETTHYKYMGTTLCPSYDNLNGGVNFSLWYNLNAGDTVYLRVGLEPYANVANLNVQFAVQVIRS